MKKSIMLYVLTVAIFGCVSVQSDVKPGYNKSGHTKPASKKPGNMVIKPGKMVIKPGKVNKGLRDVYIPRMLWNAMGLGKRAMLVSIDGGVTSIYHTDKLSASRIVTNSFPKGRTIVNEIRIIQTHNSPDCFSYWDGLGNQKWWPRDCPK